METYKQMSERHQKIVDSLPIYYALSDEQLDTKLAEIGCSLKDVMPFGYGGFHKREDKELIKATFKKLAKEMKDALKNYDFLVSAFRYELANHEYCVTFEPDDTFAALGLSVKDVYTSEFKLSAFKEARQAYLHGIWPDEY